MENLKEIGGFPGYCVDNTGNVFSVKTDVMLKPWKITDIMPLDYIGAGNDTFF